MLKTLTKKRNKKIIIVYYVLALVFVSIGLYQDNPRFYIVAVVILGLALFRKYFLMKKLKD
jgi:4-hydroxybenzoate polyprenyltransferase|tara:strand:- start:183 stop:365 length:183 start_codon:yes stop_codon:yes gene_type:complete